MKNLKLALAATALLAVAAPYAAQAQSSYDDQQQLIAQIQADKRSSPHSRRSMTSTRWSASS
jgi:hypothetical protein